MPARFVVYAKKLFICIPVFFLSYFLLARIFILLNNISSINIPNEIVLLIFSLFALGIFLLPSLNHLSESILKNLKESNFFRIGGCILFSFLLGGKIAFIAIADYPNTFSSVLMWTGAVVAIFIFLFVLSEQLSYMGKATISVLSAFRDFKFLFVVILLNIFAVVILYISKQPYFWDNAGYWRTSATLSQLVFSNPYELINKTIYSIFNSDYNYLPAIIPATTMAIFGTSRLVFVLSIVNFYVVPFWAIIYTVSKPNFFIGLATCILALPAIPHLALLGFLDVCGIFLGFAVMYAFLYDKKEKGWWLGVLLCITTLLRRWYIFYSIGFLVCAAIMALFFKEKRSKFIKLFIGFGGTMGLFFQEYISNILSGKNYSQIYSAYKFAAQTDVMFTFRYFGWFLILFTFGYSIYTAIVALKKQKNLQTAFEALFPFLCCGIIFLVFLSVQSFGQQHLLLFTPPLALIVLKASQDSMKKIRVTVYAISALCFFSVFIPNPQPTSLTEIDTYAAFPSFSIYPSIREDATELKELDKFIKDLDGEKVVLASSFVINSDLLALVNSSLNPTLPLEENKQIIHLPQVDKRDGLPYDISKADYIITAIPEQTHLDPQEQLVVTIPTQAIVNDTPFSNAFEKMNTTFTLQNEITVLIYKRLRPNTQEEMEWLWKLFA